MGDVEKARIIKKGKTRSIRPELYDVKFFTDRVTSRQDGDKICKRSDSADFSISMQVDGSWQNLAIPKHLKQLNTWRPFN